MSTSSKRTFAHQVKAAVALLRWKLTHQDEGEQAQHLPIDESVEVETTRMLFEAGSDAGLTEKEIFGQVISGVSDLLRPGLKQN